MNKRRFLATALTAAAAGVAGCSAPGNGGNATLRMVKLVFTLHRRPGMDFGEFSRAAILDGAILSRAKLRHGRVGLKPQNRLVAELADARLLPGALPGVLPWLRQGALPDLPVHGPGQPPAPDLRSGECRGAVAGNAGRCHPARARDQPGAGTQGGGVRRALPCGPAVDAAPDTEEARQPVSAPRHGDGREAGVQRQVPQPLSRRQSEYTSTSPAADVA
jgi:hypothetical protein